MLERHTKGVIIVEEFYGESKFVRFSICRSFSQIFSLTKLYIVNKTVEPEGGDEDQTDYGEHTACVYFVLRSTDIPSSHPLYFNLKGY
jgi:hypothetical protein